MVYHKKPIINSFVEEFISDSVKERDDYDIKYWTSYKYYSDWYDKTKLETKFNSYDLILVSSTKFVQFCDIVHRYKLNRLSVHLSLTYNCLKPRNQLMS